MRYCKYFLFFIVSLIIKSHLRDWDWKAGFGDTLISFVHNKVLS